MSSRTLGHSPLQLPETREMFGQSPYIVNAYLSYDNQRTAVNLTYNVQGPRLSVVLLGGTPNIYEQPRHLLNFNVTQKFGANDQWRVRFSWNNILDAEFQQTYEFKNQINYYQREAYGSDLRLGFAYSISR